MGKLGDTPLDRRDFIKQAVTGTTALTASSSLIADQTTVAPQSDARPPDNSPSEVLTQGSSGSDYMVDVVKSLGLDYVCLNPGSSFRGLHESIVTYGGNKAPEMITCCHEESAVAMAHGYFKIEGKPLAVFAHGTVGLQHASMAIYNAYCDRVPVYLVLGNTLDAAMRQQGYEWWHSVQDTPSVASFANVESPSRNRARLEIVPAC